MNSRNLGGAVTTIEPPGLMVEARKSLAQIDAQIEPFSTSIEDTSTSAQGALRPLERIVNGDSRASRPLRALRTVADAARSLKALAGYLERHPDVLLRGKGGPESK